MHNNGRSILGLGVLAFVCMFISLVNPSNAYSSELKAGAPDAEICVPAELPHTHILAFNRQMNNTSVSKETECAMTENERDLLRIATTPPTSNKEKFIHIGVEQVVEGDSSDAILDLIHESRDYMRDTVMVMPEYEDVRDICKNEHELCSFWALEGECENNPGYMTVHCSPACKSCENLDFNKRCPLDPTMKDALAPGDVNGLFERIISHDKYAKYSPTVHSRPPNNSGNVTKMSTTG